MTKEQSESFWDTTFRGKVIPSLIAAAIIGVASASLTLINKASRVLEAIESHDARLTALEKELIYIKSQMVGWDTLRRIELTLSTLASTGRSGEAARAMSMAIQNELDARYERPTKGGR